jgi:uncharacterized repeat protein (TIGR01451 family)
VVAPPVAGFTLSPASGQAPLTVTFTDTSAGNITNRFWDFGDTSTSNTTATTVAHTYNAGTNSVTLIVSSPGGNSTNTQTAAVVATNFVASADLALSVTATPEPVFAGHTLSYTLAVMNLGPQPASGVVVTNSLPATATFVSATLSQGSFTNCGQDVVCNLGSLSNTVVATLVITTTPSAATDTSIITNLASVVANESDPVSANNSARAVSTVWLDSIGDGIPDWWRAQYFGVGNATNAVSCATCDPDGDGFSNLAEFIADTNPTNSASYLALTGIAPVAGGLRLDWQGGSAARQFLQSRFDLFSTNDAWLDVFSNQPPTPLINSVTNPFGTNPLQFFRIRATRF